MSSAVPDHDRSRPDTRYRYFSTVGCSDWSNLMEIGRCCSDWSNLMEIGRVGCGSSILMLQSRESERPTKHDFAGVLGAAFINKKKLYKLSINQPTNRPKLVSSGVLAADFADLLKQGTTGTSLEVWNSVDAAHSRCVSRYVCVLVRTQTGTGLTAQPFLDAQALNETPH